MTSTAPTPLQALGELQNRTSYIAAPPPPTPGPQAKIGSGAPLGMLP